MSLSPAVARVVSVLDGRRLPTHPRHAPRGGHPVPIPGGAYESQLARPRRSHRQNRGTRRDATAERVQALSRALDVAGSRRPLTIVVVGPRPELRVANALRSVARVLPVGEGQGPAVNEEVLDDLGALLPLHIS